MCFYLDVSLSVHDIDKLTQYQEGKSTWYFQGRAALALHCGIQNHLKVAYAREGACQIHAHVCTYSGSGGRKAVLFQGGYNFLLGGHFAFRIILLYSHHSCSNVY